MKPAIDWAEYQKLELISFEKEESNSSKPSLQSTLEQIWQSLVTALFESPILRVWYVYDELGRIWWSADDPVTGRSLHHVSETQLRAWIEQRYR